MKNFLKTILGAILLFITAADGVEATAFLELESNNTFATGQLLGFHDGTIEIAGSRVRDASADFYRFFAAAGDVITAVTNSPTGTCLTQDPMHGLFNPAGLYVTSDDDSGSACNSAIASFNITTTGLWGLAVVGWEDLGFDGGGNNGWSYSTMITGLTQETARVPEPSTLVLLGTGLLAVGYCARRHLRMTSR
jgi:PEP-CTERM motif